jgi:hypothetical protein
MLMVASSGCGVATAAAASAPKDALLPKVTAQRLGAICRDREGTFEDAILIIANSGLSVISASVLTELRQAYRAMASEALAIHDSVKPSQSSGVALARDVASETQIIRRAALVIQPATVQAALVAIPHRRIGDARAAGVRGCWGIPTGAYLRAAAPLTVN